MNLVKTFYTLVATIFIAFAGTANAQQVCQELLKGGVFDMNSTVSDSFASDHLRSKYCTSSSNASGGGIEFKLPIPKLPIPLGFGASGNSSGSSNICDEKNVSSESLQIFREWSKTASQPLAQAFVDCIRAEGTNVWTSRSKVTNAFTLNVKVDYKTTGYPETKMRFSFTPANLVKRCGPDSLNTLRNGIRVGNLTTYKVVCGLRRATSGVEIGLIASSGITYGDLSVLAYKPPPIIALGTMTDNRDGVKVPKSDDVVFTYGSDTLLNRYDGQEVILPTSKKRWASWNFDDVTPGNYEVFVTYASASPRPLKLLINGDVALSKVAGDVTGSPENGWMTGSRQQRSFGRVRITRSNIELRLEATTNGQDWPHFKEMRLVYIP